MSVLHIPDGFVGAMVPSAVLKFVPKGFQVFLFVPTTGEDKAILSIARQTDDRLLHVERVFTKEEFSRPEFLYESFILPASEALRRRAAA